VSMSWGLSGAVIRHPNTKVYEVSSKVKHLIFEHIIGHSSP